MTEQPRLLFIDSYDSFTHNLVALCRAAIPTCSIHIIKNDQFTLPELLPHFPKFSAIIVGPGPGSPDIPKDIGVVRDIWHVTQPIPIFGVCLGLQSLGLAFGANLHRLQVVKHGQVSLIQHEHCDIFQDVGEVHAVRYHSLHITPSKGGEIETLAWADDGEENGSVVMAVRHKHRPFWAVQYHPESVLTNESGVQVLKNFWRLAQEWTQYNGGVVAPWDSDAQALFGQSWPHSYPHSPLSSPKLPPAAVITSIIHLPNHSVPSICESLGVKEETSPFVLLDSAANPGRYSIIGVPTPGSYHITYYTQDERVTIKRGDDTTQEKLGTMSIWDWLARFMRPRRTRLGNANSPFWGGLIGFLSYEVGVDSLQVMQRPDRKPQHQRHPDVNLLFVERSVVIDSLTGNVYVQSLVPQDNKWISQTVEQLRGLSQQELPTQGVAQKHASSSPQPTVTIPDKKCYISRIIQAQEHLFAGDSYELCLTAPTRIQVPQTSFSSSKLSSSWERYKILRKNNPAPHSAYIRLFPSTFLSSSPERFLSFSRPPNSVCQLRPIKGTVRKSPSITRDIAEKMLAGSTKEVAENLMIVDLIRHDLHGVVGQDVEVKQFCTVEEYETVWQLVSVIEGKLPSESSETLDPDGELGWEVLRRSLPPGSMTGAPKKRSVEILQTLEDDDRGIYSGVFGYWCVGGGGDWSVTIRSCFRHDGDKNQPSVHSNDTNLEEWAVGAGGAITALSDPEAEWDEMVVKLQSVLRAFGVPFPNPH
ncbi:hypothetical protein AX16_000531 [Volvariella volvacea WC 439]|nr:hypothetical protein AX16_000531 [Volvariella volvacea WC 439]